MKTLLLTAMVISNLFTIAPTFAALGNSSGGGGDELEERVNLIREDIAKWILDNGSNGLILPETMTLKEYNEAMSEILVNKKVVISFVENDNSSDDELRVMVDGVSKTCRGFISKKDFKPHILCNITRFNNTTESGQYRLIHHEYAGLVGVENNEGAASDYAISSQITNFLETTSVLKLAVKSAPVNSFMLNRLDNCSKIYLNYDPNNKVEKESALKIQHIILSKKLFPTEVELIKEMIYPHLTNSDIGLNTNATILNIQVNSDVNGDPISIELYRTNERGQVIYSGSTMKYTYFKTKNLVNLGINALELSCGRFGF